MKVCVVIFVCLYVNITFGSRVILVENAPTCFRRVLAGHRALRSFVRRAVPCETLEDCRRECAEERRFHCESFNYRLDPSFRSKGLCELMTKPIESFDIPRDFVEDKNYDFYEVDRNSLEPRCAETLGGSGFLHSGFLSSKPSRPGGWRDRNWSGYDGSGRDDRWNRRRPHDRYIPYQIGIPSLSRTLDPDNFGQYGGEYGGSNSYYKDRNDYHKSINYWQLSHGVDLQKYFGVKPLIKTVVDEDHFIERPVEKAFDTTNRLYEFNEGFGSWKRGHWNASGSWLGMEYGESNYYKPLKPSGFTDRKDGGEKDCSSRRRPGMSLGSGAIRRSLLVKTVLHCEEACFDETEFKCVSYSFRYSNSLNDNCFLSERPYRVLELSADSGSDVYAMMDRDCTSVAKKAWVESECFWHVRSGYAIDTSTSRAELTTSGLGACEAECIRAVHFYCRGFSFRFEAPAHGDELPNCILTSSPPTSLDAGHGLRSNSGHELYARGNYGRGCEPALYDDVQHPETECYLQYDKSARLIPSSIKGRAKVTSPKECGHACSNAPFDCLTYSFNTKSSNTENCFLSEVRLFDLRASVDYEHAPEQLLFSFDLFNGQCWKKLKEKHEGPSPEIPHPIAGPHPSVDKHDSGPGYLPSGPPETYPSGPTTGTGYKPTYPSAPDSKPGYLPEISGPSYPGFKPGYPPPDRPEYLPDVPIGPSGPPRPSYHPTGPNPPGYIPSGPPIAHRPGYDRPDPGYTPGYRPPPEVPSYPDREVENPVAVSWRHYTVSGFPCRRGTSCAKNQITGYWACEPEGGEIGSWDYCCAPTHRCGYSEGFNKPWCYVGPTDDQWRPCSEKYYPYHQHNVPHPSQGPKDPNRPPRPWTNRPPNIRERPTGPYISEADRKYWDDLFRDGPKSYYDKHGNPLPGYTRVPTVSRPNIRYHHNYNTQGDGQWLPLTGHEYDPPMRGELGVPRYWPVAYLHKGPPPNMTYFGYNETHTTTTERYIPRTDKNLRDDPPVDFKKIDLTKTNDTHTENNHRDVKNRNISSINITPFSLNVEDLKTTTTTTSKSVIKLANTTEPIKQLKPDLTDVETIKPEDVKSDNMEELKGIDDKIDDFSKSIEVLDIEDAQKGEKIPDLKTLEAEERQIEAIGRLLANKRGNRLVLEKRSQKDLIDKGISLDNDMLEFNFNNKFKPPERRGIIQKVTKEEIEKDRQQDKSLEVSETTFVRPPRVLSTTENVRKAIINGKVFYDASIKDREQRDLVASSTRKPKSIRFEDPRIFQTTPSSFGKKKVRVRSSNPVRRTRRVYKKRYNPEEVRRRLLDREKTNKQEGNEKSN